MSAMALNVRLAARRARLRPMRKKRRDQAHGARQLNPGSRERDCLVALNSLENMNPGVIGVLPLAFAVSALCVFAFLSGAPGRQSQL